MTADTAGVIEESDEAGLKRGALVLNVRADERVGLPHFIGVGFSEGQAQFAGAVRIGFEKFVSLDDAAKGVGSDLATSEQAFFDAQSIEGGARRAFAVDLWQDLTDGFQNVFEDHFADFAFVGTRFVFHDSDAVFLVAGVPGLNGAPGKLAHMTLLVAEAHLADGFDAGLNGVARSHVDGAEHAHFQIRRRISHDLLSLNFFALVPPAFCAARNFFDCRG